MRRRIVVVLLLAGVMPALAGSAARSIVQIEKIGDIYHVDCEIRIEAGKDLVWEVITDYDNLKVFIPDMLSSDSLGVDSDGRILVNQVGLGGFLFFSRKIRILLVVRESPMRNISFRQKEGDFGVYEGNWVLESDGEISILKYTLRAKPDFFVPGFLFRGKLQTKTAEALEAIALEVYRRRVDHKEN